eukprot:jgi/Botrbrau1/20746/Bobra.0058s0074.1
MPKGTSNRMHKLLNAGKDGYGTYDYQLLDRIVTLEKKLGMPATFPLRRGPLPSGTAVEFDGALSVPFGCAILKNQPEGQDGDIMLELDADEVPDVLADAAEGAHWSCNAAESVPEQGHSSGMLMHSDARTSSMAPRNTPPGLPYRIVMGIGVSCTRQTGRQYTKLLQLQSVRLSAEYHAQLLDKTSIWKCPASFTTSSVTSLYCTQASIKQLLDKALCGYVQVHAYTPYSHYPLSV